jgi:hypothetical protein
VGRDTSSYLLPGLQKLRQLCNYSAETVAFAQSRGDPEQSGADSDLDEFSYEGGLNKRRFVSSSSSATSAKKQRTWSREALEGSTKLQILDSLIQTLSHRRSLDPSGDYGKIVSLPPSSLWSSNCDRSWSPTSPPCWMPSSLWRGRGPGPLSVSTAQS